MGGVVCVGPEIPTLRGVAVYQVFDDALEGVFLQAHKNQTAWMMEAQRSLGGGPTVSVCGHPLWSKTCTEVPVTETRHRKTSAYFRLL